MKNANEVLPNRIKELEAEVERLEAALGKRIEAHLALCIEVERLKEALAEAMEWDWMTAPEDIRPDVVDKLMALRGVSDEEMPMPIL